MRRFLHRADPDGACGRRPLLAALSRSRRPLLAALCLLIASRAAACDPGLPLIERPAAVATEGTLAVILTGDGGWSALDRALCDRLRNRGVSVVGLSSPRYFWRARTPDGAAADLARVIREHLQAWRLQRVALIGYSRGADVLPFLASRLPADLRERVGLIALLGPELTVGFEFHLLDVIRDRRHPGDLSVVPEVRKLDPGQVVCVHGAREARSPCPQLGQAGVSVITLPGGHHFDGRYASLADRLLQHLDRGRRSQGGGGRVDGAGHPVQLVSKGACRTAVLASVSCPWCRCSGSARFRLPSKAIRAARNPARWPPASPRWRPPTRWRARRC